MAPALAVAPVAPDQNASLFDRPTWKALDDFMNGEGDMASNLPEMLQTLTSIQPFDHRAFITTVDGLDIEVTRPATLCKQCAIYSLQCVADSLGTACQQRVLFISIEHVN